MAKRKNKDKRKAEFKHKIKKNKIKVHYPKPGDPEFIDRYSVGICRAWAQGF